MTTNYQAPRFGFYHNLRRSTYEESEIDTPHSGSGTPYQDERAVRDDYSAVLFNWVDIRSEPASNDPTWALGYDVATSADPSEVINHRPRFIPYALIIPAGHSGLDDVSIWLEWRDSNAVESPTTSNVITLGSDLDINAPLLIEWNWAADSTYDDKDQLYVYFQRAGAGGTTAGETPPYVGELFLSRIVEPTRGPVSSWEHTEAPNLTTLRSETGVVTTWVQGQSLRRWSIEWEGMSNDVGSGDPSTGKPVGWNEGTADTLGSAAFGDPWLIYDFVRGTGSGTHPFWMLPPNEGDWVLVRIERSPVKVENDFPAPGVRTTDSVRFELVEVLG